MRCDKKYEMFNLCKRLENVMMKLASGMAPHLRSDDEKKDFYLCNRSPQAFSLTPIFIEKIISTGICPR